MMRLGWKGKAVAAAALSVVPNGEKAYERLQWRFGRLNLDVERRAMPAITVQELLGHHNLSIRGMKVLELGTGHKPVLPFMFLAMGAKSVVTVDRNQRLVDARLREIQLGVVAFIENAFDDSEKKSRFPGLERLKSRVLVQHKDLEAIGIHYKPGLDVRDMKDSTCTFDFTFSISVLEHIRAAEAQSILDALTDLMGTDAISLHVIDMSDHFAHTDDSISSLHFLRFSPFIWKLLAGNGLSYCNRIRASGWLEMFSRSGQDLIESQQWTDVSDVHIPVHGCVSHESQEDLRCTGLWLLSRKHG